MKKEKINIVKQVLYNNQLLESNFFDFKKYSFFLNRSNSYFSIYQYKKIFKELKYLLFILKNIKIKGGIILFIGLTNKDYFDFSTFNEVLKKLVISQGHLYADSTFKSYFYNRWSLYKRYSNPSDFFLNLQKNNKFPCILFSFSKTTDDTIFKEFSKFGIPIIYILEGFDNLIFKDYPLTGKHSKNMLNFYLDLLRYSFKDVS